MIRIFMGESASGKDYIYKYLIANHGYNPVISTTSRPIRDGEQEGVEYYFKTKDEFLQMIENDELIEYRTYNTTVNGVDDVWYYGLSKQVFDDDKDYIVILDVKGCKDFIDCVGVDSCKVYYVFVPSELREERARIRGSFDQIEWQRRLADDSNVFSDQNMLDILGEEVYNKVKIIYNYDVVYRYDDYGIARRKFVDKDIKEVVRCLK